MNSIRFHYIELDGPHPVAASLSGGTLHLMINAKVMVQQDEWVRECLLNTVAELVMAPPAAAQRLAQVIDMEIYLHRNVHGCPGSTSHMVTAD